MGQPGTTSIPDYTFDFVNKIVISKVTCSADDTYLLVNFPRQMFLQMPCNMPTVTI